MIDGRREAIALASTLGAAVRSARRSTRLTQAELADRVGLSQGRISEIERGLGAKLPLGSWISIGLGLGRPLAVSLSRPIDPAGALVDAGHLELQESILRLLADHGYDTSFELPTRLANPAHSIDVVGRDRRTGQLVLVELWNTFGDLGAAARSTNRKIAEAGSIAPVVRSCWVVRASAANRAIVARYPTIFASRFPGSSLAWARVLTDGSAPPAQPGLVWWDSARKRCTPWRRRSQATSLAPIRAPQP